MIAGFPCRARLRRFSRSARRPVLYLLHIHLEDTAVAITILSSRELTPGRREGVFWVCSCKIAVVSWTADGILPNRANSGSGLTPRPECRFAKQSQSWPGMGLFVQKPSLVFSCLRSWVQSLSRGCPLLRYGAGWCRGILRNRANSRGGPLYAALTSGVSVAGGWIAGFGVVPRLGLVSVSWGWKNK